MKYYKIILFVSCLTNEIIESQTNLLIKTFNINDNEIVRNEIKKNLDYFLKVKEILKK